MLGVFRGLDPGHPTEILVNLFAVVHLNPQMEMAKKWQSILDVRDLSMVQLIVALNNSVVNGNGNLNHSNVEPTNVDFT